MDRMIKKFKNSKFDIITNQYPRTYPKGLACEVAKTKIFLKFLVINYQKILKSTFLIIFIKIQKIIIFIIFLFIGNTINLKIEILV